MYQSDTKSNIKENITSLCITQYGSTVHIGIAMDGPAL